MTYGLHIIQFPYCQNCSSSKFGMLQVRLYSCFFLAIILGEKNVINSLIHLSPWISA